MKKYAKCILKQKNSIKTNLFTIIYYLKQAQPEGISGNFFFKMKKMNLKHELVQKVVALQCGDVEYAVEFSALKTAFLVVISDGIFANDVEYFYRKLRNISQCSFLRGYIMKIEKRKERKTSKDALRERERMKKRYRHNRKKPLPFFLTAKKKYPIAI